MPTMSKCFSYLSLVQCNEALGTYIGTISDVTRTYPHKYKSHGNKTKAPKLRNLFPAGNTGRLHRKVDAALESNDEIALAESKNTDLPTPFTMLIESADSEILYSFDKEGRSPNENGTEVGLDSLVDRAEEKWESRQTERMVKEYEILNSIGETERLRRRKCRSRAGQVQEEEMKEGEQGGTENDEGFEVI